MGFNSGFKGLTDQVIGRETRVHAGRWHAGHSYLPVLNLSSLTVHNQELPFCAMLKYPRQVAYSSVRHTAICLSTLCFARLSIQVWGKRPGNSKQRQQIFLLYTESRPVKRQVLEDEHTSSSRVEVKNEWSYTSSPAYVFTALCLTLR